MSFLSARVFVFFPVGDQSEVHGTVEVGSTGYTELQVDASSGGSVTVPIAKTALAWSAYFVVRAASEDTLTLTPISPDMGPGPSALEAVVPPLAVEGEPFVCCMPQGTCQPLSAAKEEAMCPGRDTGAAVCITDADCAAESGQTLPLDPATLTVDSTAKGVTPIQGTGLVHDAMVHIVKAAGGDGVWRLTDHNGAFTTSAPGKDGDLLQVQLENLAGERSRPMQIAIP
jgi:hypothetical protein